MIGVVLACIGAPLLSLFALGAFKVSSRADDTADQVRRQIAHGENPFSSALHDKDSAR